MSIDVFSYGGEQIRTKVIDGEPCVLLADVARALGLRSTPAQIAQRLPEGVRRTDTLQTAGGAQRATYLTEAGLYRVVLRSDAPNAEAFISWVTEDVLPTLRKTGSYGSSAEMLAALPSSETLALAAAMAKRAEEAEADAAEARAELAEAAPKVDLADNYLNSQPNGRLVREVAKALGRKESWLRTFLLDEGLIFARHAKCGTTIYDFRAEFRAHFETREKVIDHSWGTCSHYTLFVTPRGVELIRRRMATSHLAVVS